MIKVGTDKFNRYNIRSKINFKLTDWWTLGNNTSFVTSDYESPYYLGSSFYWKVNRCSPLDPIYNPDGSYTNAGASIFGKLQDGGRWNQQKTTLTTHFFYPNRHLKRCALGKRIVYVFFKQKQ